MQIRNQVVQVAMTVLISCSWLATPSTLAQESKVSESQGVNLTIYNQNFGLVKDIRNIDLKDGINYIRFEDVASQIDPTSVSFQSLTAPNSVSVREQNYQYDVLNPNTILSKSVGKNIKFTQFLASGQVRELSGVLLNPPQVAIADTNGTSFTNNQGLVLKTADGILLNPYGMAELAELPSGLVSKPSLLWKIETNKPGLHKSEITYQTNGMNWHCDYVAVANADDTKTDITSWVTLDNKSGASYKNANIKLIAGDVHKVQPPRPVYRMALGAVNAEAIASQFTEQSFAEYHLYTLHDKTNVNQNETKQLSLLDANGVPTKKSFVFEPVALCCGYDIPSSGNDKVKVKLEFDNSESNHLGMPMPKGKVRVYKRDQDGALQFVGEDMIDHTPRNEKVRLYLGDAFDLVGERKQTSTQQVSDKVQRMTYEIDLRNHKDTDVTITAVEHSWGQWKITSFSQPYTKKDSRTFEFAPVVPANGEVKITYTIETKN